MTGARAAREEVDLAVERFVAAAESERLMLFRMHLQATIRSASPLVMDLAEQLHVDLVAGFQKVRPPSQWPWRPRTSATRASVHPGLAAYNHPDPRRGLVHGMFRRRVADPGFVHFGDGDDLLAFHFDGQWLSMEGWIGSCNVRVVKGMAALTLPPGFPDTLALAMVGRQVDALVDSPALAGRGYRVRRVREAKPGAGPTLVFHAGRMRLTLPWPHLLSMVGADPFGRPPEGVLPRRGGDRLSVDTWLVAGTSASGIGGGR